MRTKERWLSRIVVMIKGTATVTTTTTIKPVAVTEIREGVVLSAGQWSMIVRDAEGVRKKFTQDQVDQRILELPASRGARRVRASGSVPAALLLCFAVIAQQFLE